MKETNCRNPFKVFTKSIQNHKSCLSLNVKHETCKWSDYVTDFTQLPTHLFAFSMPSVILLAVREGQVDVLLTVKCRCQLQTEAVTFELDFFDGPLGQLNHRGIGPLVFV